MSTGAATCQRAKGSPQTIEDYTFRCCLHSYATLQIRYTPFSIFRVLSFQVFSLESFIILDLPKIDLFVLLLFFLTFFHSCFFCYFPRCFPDLLTSILKQVTPPFSYFCGNKKLLLLLLAGSRVGFGSVLSRFWLTRVGVVSVLSRFCLGVVSVV